MSTKLNSVHETRESSDLGQVYRNAVRLIAAKYQFGFENFLSTDRLDEWERICGLKTTNADEIFTWTKQSLAFLAAEQAAISSASAKSAENGDLRTEVGLV